MRIALVSPWSSPCGISVYAGEVYRELIRQGHEVKVLANEEPVPTESPISGVDVARCWSLAEKPSWRIERALAGFHPDLIHVQHEIGYFQPLEVWQDWLAFFETFRRPLVVTYHSLPDVPTAITDSRVTAAIVPSPIGAALLRSRTDLPVYNIEHGVDGPIEAGSSREPHSLVTFGFLSQAKGYSRILQAMSKLAGEIPDLTLTIIAALTNRWQSAQMAYFNQLLTEIHQRGLVGRVDVSCGFRTMREVKSTLRRKSIGVLHYDRTESLLDATAQATSASMLGSSMSYMSGTSMSYANEGVSAAPIGDPAGMVRRYAVRCQSAALFRLWSCGLPTVVSKSQYFEVGPTLRPAVIESADSDALAETIHGLCLDQGRYEQATRELAACVTRTWQDVASDHVAMFEEVLGGMRGRLARVSISTPNT